MTVAFPVFVLEKDSRTILRFDSLDEMQGYLERIDVENEEYEAWDANGWPIRMTVQKPLWLRLELSAQGPKPGGLLSDLRHFAQFVGVKLDVEDETKSPTAIYEKIVTNKPQKGILRRFVERF